MKSTPETLVACYCWGLFLLVASGIAWKLLHRSEDDVFAEMEWRQRVNYEDFEQRKYEQDLDVIFAAEDDEQWP